MRSDDANGTEAGEVFLWPKRGTSAARLVTDLAELVTRRCSVRSAGRTVSWGFERYDHSPCSTGLQFARRAF